MRLWTIHPEYLDSRGLVALWRESLLARAVLSGKTSGYRSHPQLVRFRSASDPIQMIDFYLYHVYLESLMRGYQFDSKKLSPRLRKRGIALNSGLPGLSNGIDETMGQLKYEWRHFLAKIKNRDSILYRKYRNIPVPGAHPIFSIVDGAVREWEKMK